MKRFAMLSVLAEAALFLGGGVVLLVVAAL